MILSDHYSLLEHLELITSSLILLTSFVFLMQNRIPGLIRAFAWQSGLLVMITLLQAISIGDTALYISAAVTFLLKVLFIPYVLQYLVRKLNIRHNVPIAAHPSLLLMGAALIVLFCYHLIAPIQASSRLANADFVAIAISVTLLGMLLLISHRKAISHVIGFMSMENGIFFAALVATHGMPMTVELGIAFDVLIAMVLFGVFFFHLRHSIDSFDVDRMNLLREDTE